MSGALINLTDYTSTEMGFYCSGAILWVIFYALIIRNAHRNAFVGLPVLGIWAYMSWELLWGFVYKTDMGTLFSWGLKVYLPMSGYIGWLTLRYGSKQFSSALFRRYSTLCCLFVLVACVAVFYFFIPVVDDMGGMTSATILNLFMSASFIPLLIQVFEQEGVRGLDKLPISTGWLKLGAVCSTTLFCMLHLPERKWLHALSSVVILLDVAYLLLYYRMKYTVASSSLLGRQGLRPSGLAVGGTAS